MADIEDITGWRDEYRDLEARWDDEWVAYLDQFVNQIRPKVHVSQVLHFIKVLLENEDTLAAMKEVAEWEKLMDARGPFRDDAPEMELYPKDAVVMMNEFWPWFCFKASYPPVYAAFGLAGVDVASDILRGDLPGVQSPETKAFLLKRYAFILTAGEEGDLA
ncbi:hypothetical protein K1718_09555 [Roseibium porphyridii]|uniref:Uncharacterized protein n=1 Tax=Roseibium porphyridii TaxID=2866279 RepID=A0ABY8F7V6_9HYPH|nr:hypothetical protein [Roseibium sp. KMA01]WFE91583.1 hypothetical protein K1718_09555 [Roseibium sp. KMA01]